MILSHDLTTEKVQYCAPLMLPGNRKVAEKYNKDCCQFILRVQNARTFPSEIATLIVYFFELHYIENHSHKLTTCLNPYDLLTKRYRDGPDDHQVHFLYSC